LAKDFQYNPNHVVSERTSVVTRLFQPLDVLNSPQEALLVDTIIAKNLQADRPSDVEQFSARLASFSAEQRDTQLQESILQLLTFSEMDRRYENIPAAYRKTFDWMFESSNFTEWLRGDNTVYWITGKPGSGKSTLMKFIYRDPRFEQAILSWAQQRPLAVAGSFLWTSGMPMQRSRSGLLQSILHQLIVALSPQVVPRIFPKRWKSSQAFGFSPESFDWAELEQALKLLVQDNSQLYLLVVDGLDEVEGDPTDLVQLIQDLSTFPNIKMCVASRPWIVFEEAFSHRPGVRLEDLTKADMLLYVTEKLQSNSMFSMLEQFDPVKANFFIQEVTDKASGVFLWVYIVVGSLLVGLSHGDSLEDLQARLDALPSDLEQLFLKIMNRLNPAYFQEACVYIQLMKSSIMPIRLLDFSLAREGVQKCFEADIKPFTKAELSYRAETTRRNLSSRLMGLLEVPTVRSEGAAAYVYYLHRTVRDFFQRDYAVETVKSGLPKGFQPELTFSAVYLWELKATELQCSDRNEISVEGFWDTFHLCVLYICKIPRSLEKQQIWLCHQLDTVSVSVWNSRVPDDHGKRAVDILKDRIPQSRLPHDRYFWGNTLIGHQRPDFKNVLDDAYNIQSFFDLAFHFNLYPYVRTALGKEIPLDHKIAGHLLLDIALRYSPLNIILFECLLEAGADINAVGFGDKTLWQRLLDPNLISFLDLDLVSLCLDHGADPHLKILDVLLSRHYADWSDDEVQNIVEKLEKRRRKPRKSESFKRLSFVKLSRRLLRPKSKN
jgi:hypothetical protein